MGLLTRNEVTEQAPAVPAETVGKRTRKALDELTKAEARQAQWEAQAGAKRAELEDLEGCVGTELLAAAPEEREATSARLSSQVATLRAGIDVDNRTAQAAAAAVVQAKHAVLRAEAEDVRDELRGAEAVKAEHDRRLQALLDQLTQLDGAKYVPYVPRNPEPGTSWAASKSQTLGVAVERLRLRVELLEAGADGRPVPTHRGGLSIDTSHYSPRLRGAAAYFPELVTGVTSV